MEAELKSPPIQANETADKSRWKFYATIGIFVCCVLLYSLMICGCHFHPIAMIPALAPLVWSIFLLASYLNTEGRIDAWVAFGFALLWLWMGVDSNLKFAPFWTRFAEFVILHTEKD